MKHPFIVSSTQTLLHLKRQKLSNYQKKITVKATNHKDIHKNLFELADRRMEIKKMR